MGGTALLFLALFKLNFLRSFQYRGYMIIRLIGSFVSVFVEISLWTALFNANPLVRGTTFNDMIRYMTLTALLGLFRLSGPGRELGYRITSGAISTDLIRPYRLKPYLISQSIGGNLAGFITYTVPVYAVVLIIYGIKFPSDPIHIVAFLISIMLGAAISFYFSYIMGMLPFWLQSTWYISWVEGAMFTLFAGSFVPLWFYPDLLIRISYFLPFRYITYEAVTFYLGRTSLAAMMQVLVVQLLWISILGLLEALLWQKAQKKLMVFGG